MMQFYNEYNKELTMAKVRNIPITQSMIAQLGNAPIELPIKHLSWTHNIILIQQVKNIQARYWYMIQCIIGHWQTRYLTEAIKLDYYGKHGALANNFDTTLPATEAIEVKSLLNDKKNVLYIGTPCQIAGLKAFLRKPYETLLTIDIVCHGVFSSKLVALEVEYWENLFNGKLSNLRFRSKRFFPWSMGGVVNFDITDSKGKTVHVERHAKSSPTYRCFAYSGDGYSYNIRPSCYSCPFRGKGRYGDLTVGDAWGLNKKYPQLFTSYNMRNGVSILICNTMKGVNVGNKIESFYDLYAIPVESVFVQPALLPTNRNIPAKRKAIYANDNIPYGQLVEKLFNVNLEHENKMAQWQLTKMQIKSAIKRILLLR